jgi:arylsulfatase A-like enzyme
MAKRQFYKILKILLWVGFVPFLWAFGTPNPKTNVLFITIDTLRADHLHSYGYSRETAPYLDRLSREGARFGTVYCQLPATGPSHTSIFTSRYPHTHGVVANGWVLSNTQMTLAEIFKERGYETAAFVSSFPLDAQFGLDQGFDTYDDEFSIEGSTKKNISSWEHHNVKEGFDRRADVTTHKVLQWLNKNKEKPFFLWVHYFDPHAPYDPPKPFDRMFTEANEDSLHRKIALYDGEIRFTDQEIEKLLKQLDMYHLTNKTLIVVTSDHGEGLGEHNWMGHAVYIYEEELHVPLIMRLPGRIPANTIVNTPIETIDIAPTVLRLLEMPVPEAFEGRDLSSWTEGRTKAPQDGDVYFERMHYYGKPDYFNETQYLLKRVKGLPLKGEKYGIRHNHMKFIWAPSENTEELYDLAQDPEENVNIARGDQRDLAAPYRKMLQRWVRSHPFSGPRQEIDEKTREKLRSLGYIN